MWGFTLDDIAKKAQEAAEEASKTMASQTGATGVTGANSFFNLDSMRDPDPHDAEEAELRGKVSKTLQQQKQYGDSMSNSKHNTASSGVLHNAAASTGGLALSSSPSSSSMIMKKKKPPSELSSIDVDILLNSKSPAARRSKAKDDSSGTAGGDTTATTPSAKGLWGSVLNAPPTPGGTSNEKPIPDHVGGVRSGSSGSLNDDHVIVAGAVAETVCPDEIDIEEEEGQTPPEESIEIESDACVAVETATSNDNDDVEKSNDETLVVDIGDKNNMNDDTDMGVCPDDQKVEEHVDADAEKQNLLLSDKNGMNLLNSRSMASDDGLATELKNLEEVSERINNEVNQQHDFDDTCKEDKQDDEGGNEIGEADDATGNASPSGWEEDEEDAFIDDDDKDVQSMNDPNESITEGTNVEANENVCDDTNGVSCEENGSTAPKSFAGDNSSQNTNIHITDNDVGDADAVEDEKNLTMSGSQKENDVQATSEQFQCEPHDNFLAVKDGPTDGQMKEEIIGEHEVADEQKRVQSLREELEFVKLEYAKKIESQRKEYENTIKEVEFTSKEHISRIENDNKILRHQTERLGNQFSAMEKRNQLHQKELVASRQDYEDASGTVEALKTALSSAQDENATLGQQYDALKERVKNVALELKDRRAECRDLTAKNLDLQKESSDYEAKVYELSNHNKKLEAANSELEKKNKDLSANEGGHNEKVSTLAAKNVELENKVQHMRSLLESTEIKLKGSLSTNAKLEKDLEKKIKATKEESERNLESYKRKAQAALSSANARAAAAMQAREDAELEAINARELVEEAENTKTNFELLQNQLKGEMNSCEAKIVELEASFKEKSSLLAKCEDELSKLTEDHSLTCAENSSLKSNINDLEDKVGEFQTRERRIADELSIEKEKCNDLSQKILDSQVELEATSTNRENSTSTINHLREEVKEANGAIADLKDALKSALLEKQALLDNQESGVPSAKSSTSLSSVATEPHSQGGNSATPLFYALEKQAELVTAREEITRLASLLGDAQQEKEEALHEAQICRKQLEETEAMLQRQTKMGKQRKMQENGRDATAESSYEHKSKVESSADINLEYLKNIMLKYLSAKSFNERRALIPAIAAVLCLTQEETQQAIASVDLSGGVQGVGTALLDSLASFRSPMKK